MDVKLERPPASAIDPGCEKTRKRTNVVRRSFTHVVDALVRLREEIYDVPRQARERLRGAKVAPADTTTGWTVRCRTRSLDDWSREVSIMHALNGLNRPGQARLNTNRADQSFLKPRPCPQDLWRAVQPVCGASLGQMSAVLVGAGWKQHARVRVRTHVVAPC